LQTPNYQWPAEYYWCDAFRRKPAAVVGGSSLANAVSQYLNLAVTALARDEWGNATSLREEINSLNMKVARLEQQLASLQAQILSEIELDAQLTREMNDLEGAKIDPELLKAEKWAPKLKEIEDLLEE